MLLLLYILQLLYIRYSLKFYMYPLRICIRSPDQNQIQDRFNEMKLVAKGYFDPLPLFQRSTIADITHIIGFKHGKHLLINLWRFKVEYYLYLFQHEFPHGQDSHVHTKRKGEKGITEKHKLFQISISSYKLNTIISASNLNYILIFMPLVKFQLISFF